MVDWREKKGNSKGKKIIKQQLKLAYSVYEPLCIVRKLYYYNIGKIMQLVECKLNVQGAAVIAKNGIKQYTAYIQIVWYKATLTLTS